MGFCMRINGLHFCCPAKKRLAGLGLVVLFLGILLPRPLLAEAPPPFDFSKGWVPFDAHPDVSKTPAPLPEVSSQPPQAPAQDEKSVSSPDRPLDLPGFPGLRPVEALDVLSSEQENTAFLSDEGKWREIKELEESEEFLNKEKALIPQKGFSIRFATLPRADIKAIPDERISTPVFERQKQVSGGNVSSPQKEKVQKAQSQPVVSPEACEAMNELRRRQLEAIESDRRTLSALRDALSELGLERRLSFMSKGESLPAGEELTAVAPDKNIEGAEQRTP